MQENEWESLWRGFDSENVSESPFMFRFYELLLGEENLVGKRVLEIGCGSGVNTVLMARRGAKITLLDKSREALNSARNMLDRFSLDAEVVYGDAFDYDLGGYDIVHSEGLVEHFLGKRRQRIIDIHAHATRKGGKVVIIVPNLNCPPYRIGKFIAERTGTWVHGKEYPFSSNELVFRMKKSNLKVERALGGEFILSFGWALAPLWLSIYSHLLERGMKFSSNGILFRINYNNFFANRWGRAIGAMGVKI